MQAIIQKWNELSQEYPNFSVLMQTLAIVLVLVIGLSIGSEIFLTRYNLLNIMIHASYYFVMVVGMTLVLTSAGIDISIGAMFALTTAILGTVIMGYGLPVWLGIVITLLAGTLLGALNGFLVTVLKVPPLLATLGGFASFRGLAYAYLDGVVYFGFPRSLRFFADGEILGIPVPALIGLAFIAGGHYFLSHTRPGRHIVAIGGNEEAARLAGINVNRLKFFVYTFMGFTVGVATLIVTARLNSATAVIGTGMEMHVITAVVIGGTSLFGGKGLVIGSLLGVLVLSFLQNGLLLTGFGFYAQRVLLGLIFVLIVASRTMREKEKGIQ